MDEWENASANGTDALERRVAHAKATVLCGGTAALRRTAKARCKGFADANGAIGWATFPAAEHALKHTARRIACDSPPPRHGSTACAVTQTAVRAAKAMAGGAQGDGRADDAAPKAVTRRHAVLNGTVRPRRIDPVLCAAHTPDGAARRYAANSEALCSG